MQKIQTQSEWAARAADVLPAAGFGNFDPGIFIREGKGSRVWDADGNEYIDYLIGSGPMLLGHGHPEVMEAIYQQLPRGMTFFANNPEGVELAEEICRAVKCCEQIRYVSSGGEADMYAMRLARAYTGRDKIVKFEGGYHGMSAEAQMSLAPTAHVNFPQAQPDSAGIPASVADEMLIAPFNDLEFLASLLREYDGQVAGVIAEPLQRTVPAQPGFLQGVRDLCDQHGVLLIFDEVVTGFRFAYGGAQERYGVTPDIATLGKIIGGGFPLAALGASADIMAHFDKTKVGAEGWLMQLGTLSGNPVAAVAGMKTMEILRRPGQFDRLETIGKHLMDMHREALDSTGVAYRIVGEPPLFDVVFADHEMRTYRDVAAGDGEHLATWNRVLRQEGIFKSPGKVYPSLALSDQDLEQTRAAMMKAAQALSAA